MLWGMDLLIDGYNLMHAAGLARLTYGPGDLQRARHRLVVLVSHGFPPEELPRLRVVFDAKNAPDDAGAETLVHGLRVTFAAQGREADDLIEELIEQHSAPKYLKVISSDHRLQRAARRRGASFIGSDEFVTELNRRIAARQAAAQRQQPGEIGKHSGVTQESELEQWLREFEDVEVEAITLDVNAAIAAQAQRELERKLAEQTCQQAASSKSQPGPTANLDTPQEPPKPLLHDEVDFWEQRVRELLDEES